jgi:polyisoprenoid-binding protein YceI
MLMKKLTFFLQLWCFATMAQQTPDLNQFFPIERSHSYVEFTIQYMGYARVKGRFSDFTGLIRFDEKNAGKTSVSLLIKTESIDTDHDFRDTDLKSENWFDAKKFPYITFISKSFAKSSDGYAMTGLLTIKDVTKEVTIRMAPPSGVLKDIRADAQVIFTGTTQMDRTQYHVEGKNWSAVKEGITAVSNDVTIDFSILGKQIKVANFTNWVRNEERPAGKIYKLVKEQGVKQGLVEFKSLVDAKTANKEILEVVGYMLRLEGKVPDAIAVYEANRDAFPESGRTHYSLGESYLMSGNTAKAKECFNEALKRDSFDVSASEMLRSLN